MLDIRPPENMGEHEPALLEYRHPTTATSRVWDLRSPVLPIGLAVTSVVLGLAAPNMAGGSPPAWLAALGLTVAALWYVVIRVAADREVPPTWRALVIAAAVACVLSTAVAVRPAASDTRDFALYWSAYHQVHPRLYAPACCVSAFALIKLAAWISRRSASFPK